VRKIGLIVSDNGYQGQKLGQVWRELLLANKCGAFSDFSSIF
jgi:hypothetical protein